MRFWAAGVVMGEPWIMLLMTSAGEAAAQAVVVMGREEGGSHQDPYVAGQPGHKKESAPAMPASPPASSIA